MAERYWQKEIETASREEIKAIQDERLVKTIKHVYENVEMYRNRMDEAGIQVRNGCFGVVVHWAAPPREICESLDAMLFEWRKRKYGE